MPCQSAAGLHEWRRFRTTRCRARCSARRGAFVTAHELRDEDQGVCASSAPPTGHQMVMISSRHGLFRLDLPFLYNLSIHVVLGLDLLGELLRGVAYYNRACLFDASAR